MSRRYSVRVSYTFEGRYYIKASSREEAEVIAMRDCGMVSRPHTSNDMLVEDWNFDVHPTKTIIKK